MEKEIINKVANSKLQVFDLEDYFPKEEIVTLDISQWLANGFILKETEFRLQLKEYNWDAFSNKYVALFCSTDAILPAWAFIVVTSHLSTAKGVFQASKDLTLVLVYQQALATIDFSVYQDLPVILKGCSKKPVPNEVYVMAFSYLSKVAKSIMFGEACSAVPLFKK